MKPGRRNKLRPAQSVGRCQGIGVDGGCSNESGSIWVDPNWMDLWEIDPGDRDEFVATLYFPSVVVSFQCDVWGCVGSQSEWVQSLSNPVAKAQLAVKVAWGAFIDPTGNCEDICF